MPVNQDALHDRLEALQATTEGGVLKVEEVEAAVLDFLATLNADGGPRARAVREELEALSRYIHTAKAEIAALRPDDIKAEYLPHAADELDAIVEATAGATHEILDCMEVLESLVERMDEETSARTTDVITRIYEACGFQDITGQRTTKVVNALKHIEARVDALVGAFGEEIAKQGDRPSTGIAKPGDTREDADLLNGPQPDGKGVSQADIDALFS